MRFSLDKLSDVLMTHLSRCRPILQLSGNIAWNILDNNWVGMPFSVGRGPWQAKERSETAFLFAGEALCRD